jgi:hypothetical protein
MKTRYLSKLQAYPPVLIRLLARNEDGTAMTDGQLAAKGCPFSVVRMLSVSTKWCLPLDDCDKFLHACGADPGNYRWVQNVARLKRRATKWIWLTKSPDWPAYRELLRIYYTTI